MSKQFRFYMLPQDVQELMEKLRESMEMQFIETRCAQPPPVNVVSLTPSREDQSGVTWQLISSAQAPLQFNYYDNLDLWIVDGVHSETIEFSGCGYRGSTITEGRFYCMTDKLLDGEIWRKRPEFLKWADRVFRFAKRNLKYSSDLEAYVGKAAAAWRESGGRFGHCWEHPQSTDRSILLK